MKIPVYLIIVFLLAAVSSANAQSPVVFKYKNNPTYSIHNYKQPAHAEVAKKYNLERTIVLDYIPVLPQVDKTNRNYKAHAGRSPKQVSGGNLPATPKKKQVNSVFAPGNYKRQF
jgi:hypothetical protein